jgi:hypothetical protein
MSEGGIRQIIYNTLSLRETEDLVEIWQNNDRVEWSGVAFEVIGEILRERSVEIPPQGEQILEHPAATSPILGKIQGFFQADTGDISKFGGEENLPVFYDPRQVLRLEKWIDHTIKIVTILYAINSVTWFSGYRSIVQEWFFSKPGVEGGVTVITVILIATALAIQIGITFAALKGLAYILKILMQFEFNSRGVNFKKD